MMKPRKPKMHREVTFYPDGRKEVGYITEAEYRRRWGAGMTVTGRMAKRLAEGTAARTPPEPGPSTPPRAQKARA